jgi:hypothetical protein
VLQLLPMTGGVLPSSHPSPSASGSSSPSVNGGDDGDDTSTFTGVGMVRAGAFPPALYPVRSLHPPLRAALGGGFSPFDRPQLVVFCAT